MEIDVAVRQIDPGNAHKLAVLRLVVQREEAGEETRLLIDQVGREVEIHPAQPGLKRLA